MMKEQIESGPVHPVLVEALGKIEDFIENATGTKPSPEELAPALTKYFVLKEVLEFIKLTRSEA